MAQYCRYCCWCCVGDVAFCSKKQRTMSDKQAKHSNNCKWFDYNPLDAFGEGRVHKPRKKDKMQKQRLF